MTRLTRMNIFLFAALPMAWVGAGYAIGAGEACPLWAKVALSAAGILISTFNGYQQLVAKPV